MKYDLIAIGDPHLCMGVQTPAGRHPETFTDEQQAKLKFIGQYAQDNQVSSLVAPGDILNYKNPSLYTAKSINTLMGALSDLNKAVKTYSISGNHDLKMSSRQMKPESVYNIFTQGQVIEDVNHRTVPLTTGKKIVTLSGVDYNPDHEDFWQELHNLDKSLSPENVNILVIHEHLVPQGHEVPFCHFLTYDQFLEFKNFDVVIAGHLHKGYPTEQVGGAVDIDSDDDEVGKKITFVNPWALTRLARDYYAVNDEHKPELVHLTIDPDTKEIEFKHVEIPHKSFDEAFIKADLSSAESRNLDITEFVSSLEGFEGGADVEEETASAAPEQIKERIQYYMEQADG